MSCIPLRRPHAMDAGTFRLVRSRSAQRAYQLLLASEGTTMARWSLPQGLPPRPGLVRPARPLAAVPTSAGTGHSWIHTQGEWEFLQQAARELHLRLRCRDWTADYHLYSTPNRRWHLERLDSPDTDALLKPPEPMLAAPAEAPPSHGSYLYEVKWDGFRALITVDEGRVTIHTRRQRDVTACFPDLVAAAADLHTTSACLDGEIICPDAAGQPVLGHVLSRVQTTTPLGIARAQQRHPVICYLFDCLYLDGRPLLDEPLEQRRQALHHAVAAPGLFRVSPAVTDGACLWAKVQDLDLEGIVAKPPHSRYHPGRRSGGWLKVKVHPERRTTRRADRSTNSPPLSPSP